MNIGLKQQTERKTPEQARKELLSIIMDTPDVFFSLLNDYIHEISGQQNFVRDHIHGPDGHVYIRDERANWAQPHTDRTREIEEIRHLVHQAQNNQIPVPELYPTSLPNMPMDGMSVDTDGTRI